MPFWWRRRRRFWTNHKFNYTKRRKYRKRWPRRRRRRRPYRRPFRRRRRKLRKVKRKKKALIVKQWQPDSIRTCKIIGQSAIVVGAEGKQMYCYTVNKLINVPPKTPYGGGFGVDQYTLKYLYEEYRFAQNIWTQSNVLKDLCRYIKVKLIFYRDNKTDFVFSYDRNPPFQLTKFTYPGAHPQQIMLQKHHKFILSQMTKPNGRLTKKITIKPPKQMLSKWFFSKQFCKYPLLSLKASALDLRHSYLGCCNENPQVFFYYLNHGYYIKTNWGAQSTTAYRPNTNVTDTTYYKYKNEKKTIHITSAQYNESISYDKGYFQSTFLQTQCILTSSSSDTCTAEKPLGIAIYNPVKDNGDGNMIYLVSTLANTWDQPPKDSSILIQGVPIWLGLFGYLDYCRQIKADKTWLDSHVLVIQSPAIFTYPNPGAGKWYCPLSQSFINGNGPYNQPPTQLQKAKWFPQIAFQQEIINTFVESGPFVPKYANQTESNWELKYKYLFTFKWGGPQFHEPEIADPSKQEQYDVPDTFYQTIQIEDPEGQDPRSLIHDWDYRRGFIKERSLKRMSTYFSTHTDQQATSEEDIPKKKKRIGPQLTVPQQKEEETLSCLLSLCKKDTFQETETQQDLQQLIKQQQEQQLLLKRNILQLIHKLKENQQMLQLHTGMLP
nr:MAG: ORF1 [Torque teno midi virus]